MELPKRRPEFDIDAYMAWEEDQPERHEYLGGEVFAKHFMKLVEGAVLGAGLVAHVEVAPGAAVGGDAGVGAVLVVRVHEVEPREEAA